MSVTPFQPITKEHAAEILGASIRSIENYINEGLMPAPVHIGRRVYWHPDAFYGWLDAHLRVSPVSGECVVKNEMRDAVPNSSTHSGPSGRKGVSRVTVAAGAKAVKGAEARSKALIAQLHNV